MAVVLDIETVGLAESALPPRALEYLRAGLMRDAPDPAELERRYADLVSRFSLDPTTGRIIVIGTLDTETGSEHTFSQESEQELLESFWAWVGEREPDRYVTFSGKRFDVPYINIRSAIHALRPSAPIPTEPLRRDRHFDIREVLEGGDRRRRGSLDYFCAIFGVPSPKASMDGAGVGAAYEQGRLGDIVRYCVDDCRATRELYVKLAPFFP